MPTIIDSLIVTLGLDPTNFNKNKTQVDAGLTVTKNKAKEADKGFKDVTNSATKFLAIIGGAATIKAFVDATVESSAAIYRLSQNLNIAVETLSAWGNATTLAGGNAGGLQGTMSMLSKAQTELQLTGQSGLIPYFSALSIAFADVEGKARPAEDILFDIADRFEGMDRSKANNIGLMMGIDQGTLNAMLEGRKSLELVIKKQQEFNVITKKQGEESVRLQRSFRESKLEFSAFGRELLSNVTPALESLLSVFSNMGAWMRENKEFVIDFLKIVGVSLGTIAAATIPINTTALALGALGAALALAWQDYQVWLRGGQSALPWDLWEPSIKKAGEALKWLAEYESKVFYKIFAGFDTLKSLVSGDWAHAKFAFNEMINGTPAPTFNNANVSVSTPTTGRLASLEKKYGLPTGLLDNVWKTESNRGKNMLSSAGAEGHFQFMPMTAKKYGLKNPYDFNESSDAAARYYRDLLRANGGDLTRAAAAYNWGQGNLNRKGLGAAPSETLGYIKNVTAGIGGASQYAARPIGGNTSTANNQTNIGEIKVYTQATDAKGIADDMKESMNYLFTSQSVNGAF